MALALPSRAPRRRRIGRGFHPIEGGPDMFFHTRTEAQPWVAFDLGAGASFEEVTVRNRLDCCQERAAPLVLECSDDGRAWRELARRDGKFYLWTARFPRRVARHLRLRVPRVSTFHLAAVEVR